MVLSFSVLILGTPKVPVLASLYEPWYWTTQDTVSAAFTVT